MNHFDIVGKNAIVTGGNKGLGKSMVEALCEAGARVAIIASSESVFSAASELQEQGYEVHAVRGDLSDKRKNPATFEEAVNALGGKLDILINNAAIQKRNKCEDFSLEDWESVININLSTVFQLCQLAGRMMIKQGKGKIINVASMLSFFGGYTVPAYAASKGGVAQLTKALSNEWAGKGINVNAIAPGYMDTIMNINLIQDNNRNKEILSRIPIGRWGTPEDIKGIIIFLASEASNYVSGAVIPVDGGYLAR